LGTIRATTAEGAIALFTYVCKDVELEDGEWHRAAILNATDTVVDLMRAVLPKTGPLTGAGTPGADWERAWGPRAGVGERRLRCAAPVIKADHAPASNTIAIGD
jgi:hypothetical protein